MRLTKTLALILCLLAGAASTPAAGRINNNQANSPVPRWELLEEPTAKKGEVMRMATTLALILCFLAGASTASASDSGSERARKLPELRDVRKIHVGDMGTADEADRFRLLLEEQLTKKGFTVVPRAEEADAVLSGALSVRVMDDSTQARVFVKLDTAAGRRLWARDFGHRVIVNPFTRREPTKRRAVEVAESLRRDWERSK